MELRDLSSEFISFDLSPEDLASIKGGYSNSHSKSIGKRPIDDIEPWVLVIFTPPPDPITLVLL
jgi:hypothetical protein